MSEQTPQENSRRPNVRSFQYDVLLKNLREQEPEMFEQLLLGSEAESLTIQEKQQFIHGFLYNYGIRSEDERTALLERIFALPSTVIIDDVGGVNLPHLSEPDGDLPAA